MSAEEVNWVVEALRRHFGSRGVAVEDVKVRQLEVAGSLLSTIYLADVKEVCSRRRLSLVCKLLERNLLKTSFPIVMHFLNERLFFAELLPFLLDSGGDDDPSQIFPMFHFTHRDDAQCLVAIDNLLPLGYKTAPRHLDLRHSTLALQALGRFHALSYVAKKKRPSQFNALIARLQYPRRQRYLNRMFEMLNLNCIKHTISLFQELRPLEYAKYSQKMAGIVSDASELYGKLYEGHEPMAVLCHGDFKSENVMFSYDAEGNPSSIKLIDFQLLSYSSPAIDVFLLLFLSTALEVWKSHWNVLLASYHEAVLGTVSSYLECSLESLQEDFGYDVFKSELKNNCLHGFYVANFFEPLRSLDPEQNGAVISALLEEGASSEKLMSPLFAKMNISYSDEMKRYVTSLLEQVLKIKFSS